LFLFKSYLKTTYLNFKWKSWHLVRTHSNDNDVNIEY